MVHIMLPYGFRTVGEAAKIFLTRMAPLVFTNQNKESFNFSRKPPRKVNVFTE